MCIWAVPKSEVRIVEDIWVYVALLIIRCLAYVWLLIILVVTSPDEIEIWEAAVTLSLFIVMVIAAYLADKRVCLRKKVQQSNEQSLEVIDTTSVTDRNGKAELISNKSGSALSKRRQSIAPTSFTGYFASEHPSVQLKSETVVEFSTKHYAASEDDGKATLRVIRSGNMDETTTVGFATQDGTATVRDKDYVATAGTLTFSPGEAEQMIVIQLQKAVKPQADEQFYVLLKDASAPASLGSIYAATVTIVGSVDECSIEFKEKQLILKESVGAAKIKLERRGKFNMPVMVKFFTEDKTAKKGINYVAKEEEVKFEKGETERTVEVEILNTKSQDKNVEFKVFLQEDSLDYKLGEKRTQTVLITSDDEHGKHVADSHELINEFLKEEEDKHLSLKHIWKRQFFKAMNVNNGYFSTAKWYDYVFHSISFGWKSLFACLPPPSFAHGYITFLLALGCIGVLTALLGDAAKMFGCICQINDVVVATAIVSVGSSLPDLLAARFAAVQDQLADNAMSHINGSISVNVFLGLGIPWFMASIYWQSHDKKFEVDTKDIWFPLIAYFALSFISSGLLIVRRLIKPFSKCEFGGKTLPKTLCGLFLLALWIGYVVFVCVRSSESHPHDEATTKSHH